jgi:hypothetical protein
MAASKSQLKLVFSEVVKGYTKIENKMFGRIYIRHLDNHISSEIEAMSEAISKNASEQGLPTNKEKFNFLTREGIWSEKQDTEIADLKSFIHGLKLTKSKKFLRAELDEFTRLIAEEENRLKRLEYHRSELVGLTVEKYADRRTSQYYMFCSVFKNSALSERLFSQEEFDELEDKDMAELAKIYNFIADWISSTSLKRVAVSPSFMNYFYLSEDDPYSFYGKAICDMTFHQVELFGYGRYYKNIFAESQNSIPPHLLDDPDKLVEWYESRKNAAELLKRADSKDDMNVSIVGATKEDLANLGISETGRTIDLAAEAAKKGGSLNMEDLLKLQYG